MENNQPNLVESQIKKNTLFEVTSFSKLLATLLFITLPFVGFWLGLIYRDASTDVPQMEQTKVFEETRMVSREGKNPTLPSKMEPILNVFGSESMYTKKDSFVYYRGKVVPGADPITFKVLQDYATDATGIYFNDQKVDQADPETFSIRNEDLAYFFATDDEDLFFLKFSEDPTSPERYKLTIHAVPGADLDSLVSDGWELGDSHLQPVVSTYRAHDKKQVYEVIQERYGCGGDTEGCIKSTTLTVK